MRFKNILVDGNNLFWISTIKETAETLVDGVPLYTNGIKKALDYVKNIKERFGNEDSKIFYLFDNPVSIHNIRKQYDSKYKHAREKLNIPKRFYDTLNIFIELLKNYKNGDYVIQAHYLEADDLTKPIIEKYCKNEKTLIISNDLDWARNLKEGVSWHNHKEFITKDIFYDKYGFYPEGEKIQLYKAITGDKSDNIKPGLPNLRKEKVSHILKTFSNLKDFLKSFREQDYLSSKDKEKIIKNKILLEKNYQLVDFIKEDYNVDDYIYETKRNKEFLKCFFEALNLDMEEDLLPKIGTFFSSYKY